MRIFHTLLLTFLILLPTHLSAQEPHVHVRYAKDNDKTIVRTDWMFITDTPQQFIQLIFNAGYKGQQLQSPPNRVDLVVWTFSREVMYRESKDQKLTVKTGGEDWGVLPQTYMVFKGETKNGQDIFWEEKRVPAGQPSSLPRNAKIKSGGGIDGIFMEQLYFQLNLEQLSKIATADALEMQLGKARFGIMVDYRNTVRSFLSRIDPSFQLDKDGDASARNSKQQQNAAGKVNADIINGKAISLPHPRYPLSAKNANAAGEVKVLVTVDETGKVVTAQAISGHPLLRQPAEEAARLARFTPPSVSGRAVGFTGILLYNFIQ
jgi:TonB family protein